jgi:hypothetical protein
MGSTHGIRVTRPLAPGEPVDDPGVQRASPVATTGPGMGNQ